MFRSEIGAGQPGYPAMVATLGTSDDAGVALRGIFVNLCLRPGRTRSAHLSESGRGGPTDQPSPVARRVESAHFRTF